MGIAINSKVPTGFAINGKNVGGLAVNGDVIWKKASGVTPYLALYSDTAFTLTVYYAKGFSWNGTMYYSTDAVNWSTWSSATVSSSDNGTLYLRGTGNTTMMSRASASYAWKTSGDSNLRCVGNIENLLDWETVANGGSPTMTTYCFNYLFYGWTNLILPPDLPTTTLATYCYYAMFQGCTSLKVSETQSDDYSYEWRIPTSGTIDSEPSNWNANMLASTGGTFTDNPSANTPYYLKIEAA